MLLKKFYARLQYWASIFTERKTFLWKVIEEIKKEKNVWFNLFNRITYRIAFLLKWASSFIKNSKDFIQAEIKILNLIFKLKFDDKTERGKCCQECWKSFDWIHFNSLTTQSLSYPNPSAMSQTSPIIRRLSLWYKIFYCHSLRT